MTNGPTTYLSATDLREEGIERVLDRVAAWGLRGITVSLAYHQARDLTPHSTDMLTVREDGFYGVVPAECFPGLLKPTELPGVDSDALLAAAQERDLAVRAWVVGCHNTTIGSIYPQATIKNAVGSRGAPADLCPANPEVQIYLSGLVNASLRTGITDVSLESCHFGTFQHGYHHERAFMPLSELAQFLMGLCFCEFCMSNIRVMGIDADAAKAKSSAWIRQVLTGELEDSTELTPDLLGERLGADLYGYAMQRSQIVTELVANLAEQTHQLRGQLGLIDLSGAALGYADGKPGDRLAVECSWQLGLDPVAIDGTGLDTYIALLYAKDPLRIERDASAYIDRLQNCRFRGILRPGYPDSSTETDLRRKTGLIRSQGGEVDFYHYGLYPYPVLDRIAGALA